MDSISREQAYKKIKDMLKTGELKPGDVTSVNELMSKFKIGRSPLRDAVLRLSDEGIIQVLPRKGIFIKGINSKEVKELFQLRLAIELFAVECIIDNYDEKSLNELEKVLLDQQKSAEKNDNDGFMIADENFHKKLVGMLNNSKMNQILEESRRRLSLYGFKTLTFHNNMIESAEEHKKILDAIKNKDKKKAREEIAKHLTRTKNIIIFE